MAEQLGKYANNANKNGNYPVVELETWIEHPTRPLPKSEKIGWGAYGISDLGCDHELQAGEVLVNL